MSTELTPAMRRSALIALLRDPSMWPEGFIWSYTSCTTCAIGLLSQTLLRGFRAGKLNKPIGDRIEGDLTKMLGLSPDEAHKIFWRCNDPSNGMYPLGNVTANMVADALEALHAQS